MMRLLGRTSRPSTALLLGILLATIVCIAAYWALTSRAYVKLHVDASRTTDFRIYWKRSGDPGYADRRSQKIKIYREKKIYIAPLTNLRDVESLRIDPARGEMLFRIKSIELHQDGFDSIRISGEEFRKFIPNNQIQIPSVSKSGLVFQVGPGDAWFEYPLSVTKKPVSLLTHLVRILLLLIIVLLLAKLYPSICKGYRYIPFLMGMILVLTIVMATSSQPNVHPDEHAHRQAALYFQSHSSLPTVCATETLDTYTNYGTSRLNTNELTYYLTGKFLHLIEPLPIDRYIKARLFNVLLFALLLLLATIRPRSRILLLPILLSPQIWYLFSYYNSDAFAIFSALIIGHQIVDPGSLLRRQLGAASLGRSRIASIVALCALASILFLTKKNFYFFTLFLFVYLSILAWRFRHDPATFAPALKLTSLLVLGGGLLFSGWILLQQSANDFSRSSKILECREQTAIYSYKPSTPAANKNWSLGYRKQGITIRQMLDNGWARSMLASAFGNYGYIAYPSSKYYYRIMTALIVTLLVYVGLAILLAGSNDQKLLFLAALGMFALMVATTIYKSWTVDYQPQGRYLFPMVPIIGLLFATVRQRLNPCVLSGPVLAMFLLGLLSFLSIGLLQIPKLVF